MLRKIRKNKGFTLIELMIVVAIIGILAVLAIFGVRKYLASAKTSEATNTLGAINRMAVAAYERVSAPSELVVGLSQNSVQQLCPNSNAIPAVVPANKKYTPDPAADYKLDKGFLCLKFEMAEPQYYAYEYNSGNSSGGGVCAKLAPATTTPAGLDWQVCANGDLNGDGTLAKFTTGGKLINKQPVTVTEIAVENPEE